MLVRPLYLRPDLEAEIERAGLNQLDSSLVRQFAERGYVIIDTEIPDFDAVADRIIAEVAPHYKDESNPRAQDAWWHTPAPVALAGNMRILDTLRLLYGREPFPFQTLNFPRGTEQATHADTIHFDSSPPGFMAGVWVALEDVDERNGPLHYYPGSHRLPHITFADFGGQGSQGEAASGNHSRTLYEPGIRRLVEALGLKREEARIRKGQALIWSANLLHGGSPIVDPSRTRHSQVTHYYFKDCTYFTPALSDPVLGKTFIRHQRDVRTRRIVPANYNGRPIRPPLIRRLKEWVRRR